MVFWINLNGAIHEWNVVYGLCQMTDRERANKQTLDLTDQNKYNKRFTRVYLHTRLITRGYFSPDSSKCYRHDLPPKNVQRLLQTNCPSLPSTTEESLLRPDAALSFQLSLLSPPLP